MAFLPRALLMAHCPRGCGRTGDLRSRKAPFRRSRLRCWFRLRPAAPPIPFRGCIAESMSRTLGQTVLIENVGGAGGTLGMARVAKAAPDGYTIAVWHIAQATAPALYENLKYDVVNDFDHIGRITDVPMTLVSKTALPAKNVKELLDWIRAEKRKATYGHAGVGSASHLCALILMKELGARDDGRRDIAARARP